MKVLDIVLILPDGAERHVGEVKRATAAEPWDATLYTGVFESYLGELFDAQDVARVALEFRPV